MSPLQPPIIIEIMDMVRSKYKLMLGEILYRIDSGDSFCHVSRIRSDVRGMLCVTSGTQKWNGESQSFMVRDRVKIIDAVGLYM